MHPEQIAIAENTETRIVLNLFECKIEGLMECFRTLIFFLISIVSTYAYSSTTKVTEATANEVLTLAAGAISRVEEGRIFFKSDAIHIIDGQIYLEDSEGLLIEIPVIESINGELSIEWGCPEILVYECINCKSWFSSRPAKCSVCGGTSFRPKLVVP